jgi:probable DNA metabolism protein
MTWLLYDHSFEGLLTAIFETYEYRWNDVRIRKDGACVPLLFADVRTVVTDDSKAVRVWKKLVSLFGTDGVRTIWKAWLSEAETIGDTILETIRYALRSAHNVLDDFGNPHVLGLQQAVRSVGRESHRMEAFVRFQLTKDRLYFSVVEPDFNVLPLIASHFEQRYADQRWLIFDARRRYGIYYDLQKTEPVEFTPNDLLEHRISADALDSNESLYQNLWNDYFASTTIAARKNTKLHLQHVPRRYWKYLVEKSFGEGSFKA